VFTLNWQHYLTQLQSAILNNKKGFWRIYMMAIKNAFNLEKQFTFYASYHRQPVNVAIHLLCIWPILSTAILMLQVTVVQLC
jgi:hypothetical protein